MMSIDHCLTLKEAATRIRAMEQHVNHSPLAALQGLSQTQRERLAFIEFRLYFLGDVSRADVMTRFGLAPAGATRDFALYKELLPANLRLDGATKTYVITDSFVPAFEHSVERVLTALSQGFGDGLGPATGPLISCEVPASLNRPRLDVLAPVTRAIHRKNPVRITYTSTSSGTTERTIVPFAMVTDGLRWHVRAYDRNRQRFLDFVISRIDQAIELTDDKVEGHECSSQDIQWNRIVELELVPHPGKKYPEIAEKDYGMQDGMLRLKARAAMVGYILRHWHVDCSTNHELADKAFRLWLRDPLVLYGVETAELAPGYKAPSRTQ